jgi:hypothetical protein
MSPKEIHSLVMARAKHGTLMEQCARIVYWIAVSVGFVLAAFPIPWPFVPPEYRVITALGAPVPLLLLVLAIWEWLKRRLLTDEELSRQSLSASLKEPDPPVTPAQKTSD